MLSPHSDRLVVISVSWKHLKAMVRMLSRLFWRFYRTTTWSEMLHDLSPGMSTNPSWPSFRLVALDPSCLQYAYCTDSGKQWPASYVASFTHAGIKHRYIWYIIVLGWSPEKYFKLSWCNSSIAKFVIGPETGTFDNRALEASSMPWGAAD